MQLETMRIATSANLKSTYVAGKAGLHSFLGQSKITNLPTRGETKGNEFRLGISIIYNLNTKTYLNF